MIVQSSRVRYTYSYYCSRSKGASGEGKPTLRLPFLSARASPIDRPRAVISDR